ncbi:hypothetical protein PM082_020691 [Marasmius tenuissimus]|nr:hypothetical protein PM082_020691 [Marasmius tenuissimus]
MPTVHVTTSILHVRDRYLDEPWTKICTHDAVWLDHARTFAPNRYALKRPMFLGGFAIMMTVSGHWISSIVQLFQAFHHPQGVDNFVADPSHATQLAKNIFLSSSAVIGNMVIIYPLWIVWDRGVLITVFPILLNLGTGVTGTVVCYLFRRATIGASIFIDENGNIGPWIAAESLLSTWTYSLNTKERYPGWLIKITDVLNELQVLDIATGIETHPNPIIKAKGESDKDFKERQKSEDVSILNWDKKDKKASRAIRF